MDAHRRRRPRIVHPTDLGPASASAFAHALRLAVIARARLELLHVCRQGAVDASWERFPRVREFLERWHLIEPGSPRAAVATLGIEIEKVAAAGPDPVDTSLRYVTDHPTDLLVLGSHQRRGVARWLHRSVAEAITRASPAPVLLVPPQAAGFVAARTGLIGLRHVVVATPDGPAAQTAAVSTSDLVRGLGATDVTLTLATVGPGQDAKPLRLPHDSRWQWIRSPGHLSSLAGALAVAREERADAIVLSGRPRRRALSILGRNSLGRVLRGARCPVLVVPAGSRGITRLFWRGG